MHGDLVFWAERSGWSVGQTDVSQIGREEGENGQSMIVLTLSAVEVPTDIQIFAHPNASLREQISVHPIDIPP